MLPPNLASISIPEPFVIHGLLVCRQCWNSSHAACTGLRASPIHCQCPCRADRLAEMEEKFGELDLWAYEHGIVLDEFLASKGYKLQDESEAK
jgi:hypothetical protein